MLRVLDEGEMNVGSSDAATVLASSVSVMWWLLLMARSCCCGLSIDTMTQGVVWCEFLDGIVRVLGLFTTMIWVTSHHNVREREIGG